MKDRNSLKNWRNDTVKKEYLHLPKGTNVKIVGPFKMKDGDWRLLLEIYLPISSEEFPKSPARQFGLVNEFIRFIEEE